MSKQPTSNKNRISNSDSDTVPTTPGIGSKVDESLFIDYLSLFENRIRPKLLKLNPLSAKQQSQEEESSNRDSSSRISSIILSRLRTDKEKK